MSKSLRVLMVEDSPDDAQLVVCELRAGGYSVTSVRVETAEAMQAALERESWDIVISDYQLPRFNGLAALRLLREKNLDLPFILVSGTVGEEAAVEAMQAGANDYVMKDKLARLVPAVERELREAASRREHRRVEADFVASEVRYRRLFEAAQDGILILNAETGTVVDVNPFLIERLGLIREQLVGKKLWELKSFRAIVADAAAFAELSRRAYARFDDRQLQTAEGRRIDVEFVSAVYPVGHHTVMQCHLRDITERKAVEANLRVESAALEAAANAVVITDREGRIEWANPAFMALTGYTLGETVGRHHRDLVKSGRNDQGFYRALWATILAGRVWQGVLVNRRKDGSHYTEEMTITPVRNEAGELAHFVAIKQDITARQRAEAALHESEAKFSAAFNLSPIALALTSVADSTYRDVNEVFLRDTGYTREEVIGRSVIELGTFVNMEDRERLLDGIRRQGQVYGMPCRLRMKAGRLLEGLISSCVVSIGGERYLLTAIVDITARQQAEEALRDSTERLRLATEATGVGIWAWNVFTGAIHWDAQMFRIYGITPTENGVVDYSAWHGAVVPEERSEQAELLQNTVRRRGRGEREFHIRQPGGGEIRCVRAVEAVRLNAQGEVEWVVGTNYDITERKAAERRLREQHEIISNSHEGVMIVGLDNRVAFWNRGAEAMFGWTAAEAQGRNPDELFGLESVGIVSAARVAVEKHGFWNGEVRTQTRDGRRLIMDCRMSLVRDDAGRPRARLSFLSDITEKKILEEKFLHAQRLESIGMLAAGIAHDLNNVLAPIVFAGPLLRDSLSTARDLKILNSLEQSAARGAGLVRQILAFAHSTTGELRPTQVKHLARDIAHLIEETFPKSIRLDQQIPTSLWVVQANPTQIHQVLLNLCVNARDAMPQGGTLRITVSNRVLEAEETRALSPDARPGAWLVIEVADTGTGIAPDVLAHIWEPFYTTKGVGKGTGLGLSTVRGIVASHHGFVTLDTQVGRGTTFRVFLPATEEGPAASGTAPGFTAPAGNGELILVADDDSAIRETIATILTHHRYGVLSASDGVEALNHFTQHPTEVALVVTDVDMPLLSGTALARILKQLRPDLRLLVMSGLPDEEASGSRSQIAEAKKLSPAFIRKPFTPEALLVAVHELLHPEVKS